jgi:hypothetical protein
VNRCGLHKFEFAQFTARQRLNALESGSPSGLCVGVGAFSHARSDTENLSFNTSCSAQIRAQTPAAMPPDRDSPSIDASDALDSRIRRFVDSLQADLGEVPKPKKLRKLEQYKRTLSKLQKDFKGVADDIERKISRCVGCAFQFRTAGGVPCLSIHA